MTAKNLAQGTTKRGTKKRISEKDSVKNRDLRKRPLSELIRSKIRTQKEEE